MKTDTRVNKTLLFVWKEKSTVTIKFSRASVNYNRPFRSCLLLLCENESSGESIHMKMRSAFMFILMQIKLIFMIRKVLDEDSS